MNETLPDDCFDESGKKLKVAPQYSIQEILLGRKNVECYSFFFDKFVSLIEKKTLFKEHLKTAKDDEGVISISSEAFALLILENHWDRWLDIYERSGGKIMTRTGVKMKHYESSIQPKYTRGGLKNGKERNIGIGKGWSLEGIYRYNILQQMVATDRQENQGLFIRAWLEEKRAGKKNKKAKPAIGSAEGFACWTLSEKECQGSLDTQNVEKMAVMKRWYRNTHEPPAQASSPVLFTNPAPASFQTIASGVATMPVTQPFGGGTPPAQSSVNSHSPSSVPSSNQKKKASKPKKVGSASKRGLRSDDSYLQGKGRKKRRVAQV